MRTRRVLGALLLLAWTLIPATAQQAPLLAARQAPPPPAQPATPYRILVSNDDGVRAPGIAAVALALQALGDVTVVAPAENQSGKGHSITITEPIYRENLTLPNGLAAIGLTATPTTTVNVAIRNIVTPKPDLVVSGINRGYNLGYDAYLSGTAGAARQGAILGVAAIAASLAEAGAPRDFAAAAQEVLVIARRVRQYGMPPNTFLNVNIPARPDAGYKGYQITTQAPSHGGSESFPETKHPDGRSIYWNRYVEGATAAPGTDIWAVNNGFVSVTPMKLGETDSSQIERLRGIFK